MAERKYVGTFFGTPVYVDELAENLRCDLVMVGVDHGTEPSTTVTVTMRDQAYRRAVEQKNERIETVNDALGRRRLFIPFDFGEQAEAQQIAAGPTEPLIDGLTTAECLERYEAWQRADYGCGRSADGWIHYKMPMVSAALTDAQLDAARSAWSAALRAKTQQAEEKRRVEVVCERDEEGL